ncbi:hypothetical protein FSARC_5506 [Fusarium sarcochroum]|uniref:Uncharacterized protein n=1 Tax=Fusarium sarcochroum TaxID=1208366 RepID=A0A8H4TZR8_9HYPO|nr:hypothetical protein FSARC_5506 [Fusarium sarcochroum]
MSIKLDRLPFSKDDLDRLDPRNASSNASSTMFLPSLPFSAQPSRKLFTRADGKSDSDLDFLENDLMTPALDSLFRYLWLAGSRSYNNINPLHRQLVKGRQIVIAENPEMHLIRGVERIYIKPLPPYLLSWQFWESLYSMQFTQNPKTIENLTRQAIGFLRSYYMLLKFESDFIIAMDERNRILPSGLEWSAFAGFLALFADPSSMNSCPRYQYGEVRLTRLELICRCTLHSMTYQDVDPYEDGTSTYLSRRFGPLLFFIAALSLILGAMQVTLAAQSLTRSRSWDNVGRVSQVFAVLTIILTLAVGLFFTVGVNLFIYGNQLRYALTHFVLKRETRGAEKGNFKPSVA